MDADPERRTRWPAVAATLWLVPLLYGLGLGTVESLWWHRWLPEIVEGIYMLPIAQAYDHAPVWFTRLVDGYVELWLPRGAMFLP